MPGNPLEDVGDCFGIRVGIVDRCRQQGTSQRPVRHVGPLGEPTEFRGAFFVK